ncbi:MAG: Uncharacterized MFS-type transporter, partial [uncultured Sphingomonas sp.]
AVQDDGRRREPGSRAGASDVARHAGAAGRLRLRRVPSAPGPALRAGAQLSVQAGRQLSQGGCAGRCTESGPTARRRLRPGGLHRRAAGRGLSRQGRPGSEAALEDHPGGRHHGVTVGHDLRPGRSHSGGALPGAHPLHVHVIALSHRHRLFRRLPALHLAADRGPHGRCLRGPVVHDSGGRHGAGGERHLAARDLPQAARL